jgi:hypothetical protein
MMRKLYRRKRERGCRDKMMKSVQMFRLSFFFIERESEREKNGNQYSSVDAVDAMNLAQF